MIDWGSIVAQTPSIALALLFAWFANTLISGQREHSAKIMAEWADRLKQRDIDWQKFIDDQRAQMYTATGRLAEEIKQISLQVAALNALLSAHDRQVQDRQIQILQATIKQDTRRRPAGKASE